MSNLRLAGIGAIMVLVFSVMSMFKLGLIGDGNAVNTPLRIINRDTTILAFSILMIVIYLWKKENKNK